MALRPLTLDDVRAVLASTAGGCSSEAFETVERISAETIGWRMMTVLQYVEAEGVVVRAHSSDRAKYPIGGRKRLADYTANHAAMEGGDVFLAATADDVRRVYADHEALFALGITAILNTPIRLGNRRLGTLNLCGTSGSYGPAAVATAKVLAGLLVPHLT